MPRRRPGIDLIPVPPELPNRKTQRVYMSFFTNLRADRLIAEIKAADAGDANREALEKLGKLGGAAIPRVIDALATADKQETAGFRQRALTRCSTTTPLRRLPRASPTATSARFRASPRRWPVRATTRPTCSIRCSTTRRCRKARSSRSWQRRRTASMRATCCSTPTRRNRPKRPRCSASSARSPTSRSCPSC